MFVVEKASIDDKSKNNNNYYYCDQNIFEEKKYPENSNINLSKKSSEKKLEIKLSEKDFNKKLNEHKNNSKRNSYEKSENPYSINNKKNVYNNNGYNQDYYKKEVDNNKMINDILTDKQENDNYNNYNYEKNSSNNYNNIYDNNYSYNNYDNNNKVNVVSAISNDNNKEKENITKKDSYSALKKRLENRARYSKDDDEKTKYMVDKYSPITRSKVIEGKVKLLEDIMIKEAQQANGDYNQNIYDVNYNENGSPMNNVIDRKTDNISKDSYDESDEDMR